VGTQIIKVFNLHRIESPNEGSNSRSNPREGMSLGDSKGILPAHLFEKTTITEKTQNPIASHQGVIQNHRARELLEEREKTPKKGAQEAAEAPGADIGQIGLKDLPRCAKKTKKGIK